MTEMRSYSQLKDRAASYEFGDDDPSIASPAYQPFKTAGLLTMKYKISSTDAIDTVPGHATVAGNALVKFLAWVFPGCLVFGPCLYRGFVKDFEVPRGCIQPFSDGRGGFGFFGPGLHRIVDPALKLVGKVRQLTEAVIKNGNLTIVTVPQGNLGFALDQGEPVLLPPGLHYIHSDTLSYERAYDLSEQVVQLGPYCCITADEGYSLITQDNGKQVILPGGQVHLLTHRNWKLENVMSLKVQTDQLDEIEAASADNVQMRISSTVSWRVEDVQAAARYSAQTMDAGQGRADPRANALKLKMDVLMQAKASLASFIGSVHYSGGVGLASANAGAVGGVTASQPVPTAAGNFFDAAKINSAMAHANEACALYGVQILSINVITAIPTDTSLIKSLAAGAVSMAEARNAEVAAEGEAKARIATARGMAEAEQIKAMGAKKAADLLESSKVAVMLAQIEKTGDVLRDAKSTYFFGSEPSQVGSLLANPNVIGK